MWDNLNLFEDYDINMDRFPDFINEVKKQYNFYGNSYHKYEHGLNGKGFFIILVKILVVHNTYIML